MKDCGDHFIVRGGGGVGVGTRVKRRSKIDKTKGTIQDTRPDSSAKCRHQIQTSTLFNWHMLTKTPAVGPHQPRLAGVCVTGMDGARISKAETGGARRLLPREAWLGWLALRRATTGQASQSCGNAGGEPRSCHCSRRNVQGRSRCHQILERKGGNSPARRCNVRSWVSPS